MRKERFYKSYLHGRQYAASPPRKPHLLHASKILYRLSFHTPIDVVRRDELGMPMLLDTSSPNFESVVFDRRMCGFNLLALGLRHMKEWP